MVALARQAEKRAGFYRENIFTFCPVGRYPGLTVCSNFPIQYRQLCLWKHDIRINGFLFFLSCASFFLTLAGSRLSGKREQQAPAANRTPVVSQAIPRAADFSPDNRGFDIILLMDSSGSMKRTDPHNYRKDAARLFISLIGRNDRTGIMSFGDSAAMLQPLTLNHDQNRLELFSTVDRISFKESSTNILEEYRRVMTS